MKKIKEFFKSLWNRIKGKTVLVVTDLKDDVVLILNNKELRALALEAIINSVKSGFKDNEAWDNAFKKFEELLKEAGWELPLNIVETILQLTYTIYKNKK